MILFMVVIVSHRRRAFAAWPGAGLLLKQCSSEGERKIEQDASPNRDLRLPLKVER